MPPSQLKRLKASLHEKGILGPQKSKKVKKQQKRNGLSADQQARRKAALSAIREEMNPFDVKVSARPQKFEATSLKNSKAGAANVGRPGVAKSTAEETVNSPHRMQIHMQLLTC
jgi:nucleolar protein 14